ncbi:Disintegrin and metalloproteinase domain-containing protein 10 [Orchesella cincta]|uniref:Disintegrin and metalloproteinase domain-containing protein 10 n=1 Tax=Orchesella cincta TaxID=48709 RepID=A0A1D2MYK0_ORCCI|nr:Disintegrin and metalloproteinase domain-containing protein 10 [Orchesella cincta]
MVDQISWIFRSTDWNNDGKPDNIGVKIVTMTLGWIPYKQELPEHYDTPKLALDYLKIFARMNFSSCCLGVGFTNRQFLNGLDGISFAASRKAHGGICDHRNPLEGFMRSMNIILISARGLDGSQLSMYHITKALTHELGHAFGANLHDNEHKAHGCWGFQPGEYTEKQPASTPKLGRYIMWPKSSGDPNSKPLSNNLRFSTCSKNEIALVINERRQLKNCFIPDYNPFCGNGVVEGLEECDCGSVLDCAKQKCCGARLSTKPCMIMDAKACPLNPIARPFYGRNEILNNSVGSNLTSNYSVLLLIPFIVTIIWRDLSSY